MEERLVDLIWILAYIVIPILGVLVAAIYQGRMRKKFEAQLEWHVQQEHGYLERQAHYALVVLSSELKLLKSVQEIVEKEMQPDYHEAISQKIALSEHAKAYIETQYKMHPGAPFKPQIITFSDN